MKSEYDAMQSLAASKEQAIQGYIADRNAQARLDEQLRKGRMNDIFWRGVMRFITHITLVSIVVYALFHFA